MSEKYCQGCGALIQHVDQQSFGYVPEHLKNQKSLLCQRCFRINHYGRDEIGPVLATDSLASIREGLAWATGVVVVVDLLDFEAGLPEELLALVKSKSSILAVNKVDLLPEQTPLREVELWLRSRLKSLGLPKAKGVLVSAINGQGFPTLADSLEALGNRILFAGVTNVGKSSVLQRLLQMRIGGGQRNSIKPTISPYPGTTVHVSFWECPGDRILADSPGLVPEGRISDQVSTELATKIIPHRNLSSHLYPISAGDLMYIKGLTALKCLESSNEGLLLGFTGSGVHWKKSTEKHLQKWLGLETGQTSEVKHWATKIITLKPGEDLLIHGLGWVSARKAQFKLEVHLPEGVHISLRPNLIGMKKR